MLTRGATQKARQPNFTMSLIECQEQVYKVPIESTTKQNEYEYVIRGLREDEVKEWSEFCASVFSYKPDPPPAEYFYRHYANDPSTKACGSSRLIRIALFEGTIVASCRIFLRTISTGNGNGTVLRAGGIGEVCTTMDHRRRGVSTKLLENAIAIMEERTDLQVSSLHAGPAFFPLYESLGYLCPPASNPSGGNRWSTVDFYWKTKFVKRELVDRAADNDNDNDDDDNDYDDDDEDDEHNKTTRDEYGRRRTKSDMIGDLQLRPAQFPRDTETLQTLHAKYSEERFGGCMVRSKEYWNDYLSKELEGSLFVLVLPCGTFGDRILAWISVKPLKSEGNLSYCIQEFGMDSLYFEEDRLPTGWVVICLLTHAIANLEDESSSLLLAAKAKAETTSEMTFSLTLPGFMWDEAVDYQGRSLLRFDWASERTSIDRGWMYRGLGASRGTTTADTTVADGFLDFVRGIDIPSGQPQTEHFVWPSDSF